MADSLIEALDNPFWQFSSTLFAQSDIQKACIDLQDQKGLNVNLLLFCFWLGYAVVPLSKKEFLSICDSVQQWQKEITEPLRAARRHLKKRINNATKDAHPDWLNHYYKTLLHQELYSEAWQQHELYSQVKNRLRIAPQWEHAQIEQYIEWLIP